MKFDFLMLLTLNEGDGGRAGVCLWNSKMTIIMPLSEKQNSNNDEERKHEKNGKGERKIITIENQTFNSVY